jgi:N-acetylmuramoyl-L-alanine amidase
MSKNMQIDKSKKFSQFFSAQKTPRNIDFLVLHHVQANSANHAIEQFFAHEVSCHFLIDESGKIFELVSENDIAFHAGVSFWKGAEALNQSSIGIEFINSAPFDKKFESEQLLAGVQLCKYLIAKYDLEVVGHSDIAYNKETGFLNRKQDPSHLFDWKFFAENGVGFFPKITTNNEKFFGFGDKNHKIFQIKNSLKNINPHNHLDSLNRIRMKFTEVIAAVGARLASKASSVTVCASSSFSLTL